MDKTAVLSPFVLAELFSDPKLEPQDAADLRQLPLLSISEGFWERAGRLRAELFQKNYRQNGRCYDRPKLYRPRCFTADARPRLSGVRQTRRTRSARVTG